MQFAPNNPLLALFPLESAGPAAVFVLRFLRCKNLARSVLTSPRVDGCEKELNGRHLLTFVFVTHVKNKYTIIYSVKCNYCICWSLYSSGTLDIIVRQDVTSCRVLLHLNCMI